MKKFLAQCLHPESADEERARYMRFNEDRESWWDPINEQTRRQKALEQRVEMAQERAEQWVLENPLAEAQPGRWAWKSVTWDRTLEGEGGRKPPNAYDDRREPGKRIKFWLSPHEENRNREKYNMEKWEDIFTEMWPPRSTAEEARRGGARYEFEARQQQLYRRVMARRIQMQQRRLWHSRAAAARASELTAAITESVAVGEPVIRGGAF